MTSLLKSTVLGVGLLTGVALAAQAQSVSSLPPSGAPEPSAVTQPFTSTQTISPNPGGNVSIKTEHYTAPADYATNRVEHPYSTSIGPQPGSNSSGTDRHYQTSAWDAQPAQHPYTTPGFGPKPN